MTLDRKVAVSRADGQNWEFTLSADGRAMGARSGWHEIRAGEAGFAGATYIIFGSTWKQKDWVLDFYSTGGYHETWQKREFTGDWTIGAD